MILVDSSIWIDHLRKRDDTLVDLLEREQVLIHPFVTGEIALGHLRQRGRVLSELEELPGVAVASDAEVAHLIEVRCLFGLGLGYVDVHLLASTAMTVGVRLWTRDRRLRMAAESLQIAAEIA